VLHVPQEVSLNTTPQRAVLFAQQGLTLKLTQLSALFVSLAVSLEKKDLLYVPYVAQDNSQTSGELTIAQLVQQALSPILMGRQRVHFVNQVHFLIPTPRCVTCVSLAPILLRKAPRLAYYALPVALQQATEDLLAARSVVRASSLLPQELLTVLLALLVPSLLIPTLHLVLHVPQEVSLNTTPQRAVLFAQQGLTLKLTQLSALFVSLAVSLEKKDLLYVPYVAQDNSQTSGELTIAQLVQQALSPIKMARKSAACAPRVLSLRVTPQCVTFVGLVPTRTKKGPSSVEHVRQGPAPAGWCEEQLTVFCANPVPSVIRAVCSAPSANLVLTVTALKQRTANLATRGPLVTRWELKVAKSVFQEVTATQLDKGSVVSAKQEVPRTERVVPNPAPLARWVTTPLAPAPGTARPVPPVTMPTTTGAKTAPLVQQGLSRTQTLP